MIVLSTNGADRIGFFRQVFPVQWMIAVDLCSLFRGHGGLVFGCSRNRSHTRVSRTHLFFKKSNLILQDICSSQNPTYKWTTSSSVHGSLGFLRQELSLTGPLTSVNRSKSIFILICAIANCGELLKLMNPYLVIGSNFTVAIQTVE